MSAAPNSSEESFNIKLNNFQYLISISIKSDSLLFSINSVDKIPSVSYEKSFTFDEIIKLNRYFKMFDTIPDILSEIKNIIKNDLKNIKLEGGKNNTESLMLTFPLPSYSSKEISFEIEKRLKGEKEEIAALYKSIEILSEKIKKLEENNIRENKNYIQNLENKISELEKENIFLKNEINKINKYLFPESIFHSKISFDEKMIKDWIGKRFSSKLLFSTSKNGTEPSEFHRLCDNKGPTIIFIETTKGYKFGGYTELDWDTSGQYKKDNETFLFSINNKQKFTKRNYKYCSIYCRNDLAPSFGGDGSPDIYCMGSCKKGRLCTENTYAKPEELNNGEKEFEVKEMEVYQIILL